MGFINKSPTANFQREGRSIQWETWRIKPWKQEPKLIFQAAQPTYFPGDPEEPPRGLSGEFSLQTKANTAPLWDTLHNYKL